jgi:hypothetical protein
MIQPPVAAQLTKQWYYLSEVEPTRQSKMRISKGVCDAFVLIAALNPWLCRLCMPRAFPGIRQSSASRARVLGG